MTDKIILWKDGKTRATGQLLAQSLDLRTSVRESKRNDYKLIRWGCTDAVRFAPSECLNSKEALVNSINKKKALVLMKDVGILTPTMFTDKTAINTFPVVGRTTHHQSGTGFKFISSRSELASCGTFDYYLQFIQVKNEYRVHIFKDGVLAISRKRESTDYTGERNYICRNLDGGWYYSLCETGQVAQDIKDASIAAVTALGLDFGAVDIARSEDGKLYIFEVNSAPGLDPNGTIKDKYVEAFNAWLTGTSTTNTPLFDQIKAKPLAEQHSLLQILLKHLLH